MEIPPEGMSPTRPRVQRRTKRTNKDSMNMVTAPVGRAIAIFAFLRSDCVPCFDSYPSITMFFCPCHLDILMLTHQKGCRRAYIFPNLGVYHSENAIFDK